jgi:hypothetical protein
MGTPATISVPTAVRPGPLGAFPLLDLGDAIGAHTLTIAGSGPGGGAGIGGSTGETAKER